MTFSFLLGTTSSSYSLRPNWDTEAGRKTELDALDIKAIELAIYELSHMDAAWNNSRISSQIL